MDIISANLGNRPHNVTRLQQRRRLTRLAQLGDVLVTQEALTGSLIVPRGWRSLPQLGGGAEQVRIMVPRSRKVIGHGAIRMHPGDAGSWPARWLPFGIIELGDDPLVVVDVHLNSGIEAGGRWAAVGPRHRLTAHHIDRLADFARYVRTQLGYSCLVIGDTNVDAYADRRERTPDFPAAKMAAAGLVEALPHKRSGTLGSRRVDRCFHTRDLRVSVTDLARVDPYDHQSIRARVTRTS